MTVRLGRMTLLVRDQDEAAAFYKEAFGFEPLFDEVLPDGFRALHIGSPGQRTDAPPVGLWLMPADGEAVGHQTAGQPALVLYTDDLAGDLARVRTLGVDARPGPADPVDRVAHVHDLYGNEIVLVQPSTE